MIDNIKHGDIFSKYIAKVSQREVEQSGWLGTKSERIHRKLPATSTRRNGLTNGLGCTCGSERMVVLTKMALCTRRAQEPAGAVRLHGGKRLSKEAMNATQLFSAFV